MENISFDDEVCHCGHTKSSHVATKLDNHGGACEKCGCKLYTWRSFVKFVKV
jgi:hypothetical protein